MKWKYGRHTLHTKLYNKIEIEERESLVTCFNIACMHASMDNLKFKLTELGMKSYRK
jgi:hypothetical protein